ncbi:MAG: pentapeptide repeat-containing protein [Coleofasciculus sp. S288]|nr:pentapeptide repeat-containing protein [Coleofasciculus sp. S288]
MNLPEEYRIPEDKAQEVFTLAAQLYAQHNQSYSVKELMEAGAGAKIPPEFIQQAIDQLQLEKSSTQKLTKQSKARWIGLAIGLPVLLAMGVAGWLLTRNAATTAQVEEAPVETVNPLPSETLVTDANSSKSNFKCANLNLEGQNLSTQNLTGADCTNAQLTGANLSGVNLEGANLSKADLTDANLTGANLRRVDLAGADLSNADLSGANLEGANLSNTDLTDANLSGANIRGTDLAGAELDGAELNGADLKKNKKMRCQFLRMGWAANL